uniref:Uncharacterized protein n=1 Tax=Tanacetum cinerariifolium TaxID=118510 RepID=A0A6L2M3Y5_TANCI|nr:hypothetical protein [Tanacetum cinerariifolium]
MRVSQGNVLQCSRHSLRPSSPRNRRELIYYMDALEMNIIRRALYESECLMKAGEVHAIKEIEKRLNESKMQTQEGVNNRLEAVVQYMIQMLKEHRTYCSDFSYVASKKDNVNTRKLGLGSKNQNDVKNNFVLNKANELTPSLYNFDEMGKEAKELTPTFYNNDEMGKELLSDQKIIFEEELKCEAEKHLKVK